MKQHTTGSPLTESKKSKKTRKKSLFFILAQVKLCIFVPILVKNKQKSRRIFQGNKMFSS